MRGIRSIYLNGRNQNTSTISYSHYIEIARLSTATSGDVITYVKSLFACHGVPESLASDNGAQYVADHATSKALPRSMALHILLAAHDIPKGMGLQRGQ